VCRVLHASRVVPDPSDATRRSADTASASRPRVRARRDAPQARRLPMLHDRERDAGRDLVRPVRTDVSRPSRVAGGARLWLVQRRRPSRPLPAARSLRGDCTGHRTGADGAARAQQRLPQSVGARSRATSLRREATSAPSSSRSRRSSCCTSTGRASTCDHLPPPDSASSPSSSCPASSGPASLDDGGGHRAHSPAAPVGPAVAPA
jgi:hypothetical protein